MIARIPVVLQTEKELMQAKRENNDNESATQALRELYKNLENG